MRNKKRETAGLLTLTLIAGCLTGCGAVGKNGSGNSVFTGRPEALRVFVRTGTTYAERLAEQFPDIVFDFYCYGGLNTSMAMNQLLSEDDFGDLCITSLQVTDDIAREHLLDLSGSEICGRYEPSMLSQFDVEGNIYQLPGYVTMRSIIYNRDMFEAYGWKVPENFGEMEALCRQIREETEGITPIVMGGAATGYYFTTMTSYAQAEYLFTPEGQKWMKAYQRGEAKAEDGFGEGIRMTQELIDAGAFDYEANVGLWDGEVFEKRMLTGEAAMMFCWGAQAAVVRQVEENEDLHFGMIPFRNREGQAFIGTNIPYYFGLAKHLGERGSEKKLEQAMRVLDWLSTEEGIASLSREAGAAVYPLKGAANQSVLEINREFWNAHLDSIKAPMLYAGYEDIIVPAAEVIVEAVRGNGDLDGLAEYIDQIHGDYIAGGAAAIEVGSFAQEFTHAESVQMMAHILQSRKDSDITLVSDGCCKNGVLNAGGVFLHFFEGPILEDQITICLPGSGITDSAVQMTLTGSQVKRLLENGKHGVAHEGSMKAYRVESDPEAVSEAAFDYYYAGMKAEWKKGRVVRAVLDDGRILEDEDLCTVTFAPADYTEETAAMGNPTELAYTVRDVLEEYMRTNSPVSPVPVLR